MEVVTTLVVMRRVPFLTVISLEVRKIQMSDYNWFASPMMVFGSFNKVVDDIVLAKFTEIIDMLLFWA